MSFATNFVPAGRSEMDLPSAEYVHLSGAMVSVCAASSSRWTRCVSVAWLVSIEAGAYVMGNDDAAFPLTRYSNDGPVMVAPPGPCATGSFVRMELNPAALVPAEASHPLHTIV